jgi:ABC-2 type transport system ATP-binding protein
MNPLIEVKNLRKVFQIKEKQEGIFGGIRSLFATEYKEVVAVDDLSFSVEAGDIVAFIGPNGAGKSTTIKMLTGILFPTSGMVSVFGLTPALDRTKLAYHIGTVFGQKAQLWYHLPPIDTYNLYSHIYELDQKEYKARLDFLIESFEIQDYLHTPVRKLSLGQRMRCEIIASLIHKPQILFLDEPTIGLDVIAKQQVRDVIKYLNEEEKVTIFLTSHDAGDIEALTKRAIVINYGTIIFDDTTPKLRKDYITTKIVEIIVRGETEKFNFEGGKILERSKHRLKIEIDTTTTSIERLLNYALENFQLIDINIFEPPLEEIITAIYRGT